MTQTPSSPDPWAQVPLRRSIRAHANLFLAEGILLGLLGLGAVILPLVAGLAATFLLGWLLLAAGLAGLFFTMRAREAPGFAWSLLSALAATGAGAVLLWNPVQGLATLTLVLTAFFIIDGAAMIFFAIDHRRELSGRWEWLLINGLIDLILAAIIISGLPGSIAWALGVLLGVDLLFGGAALIAMALEARKIDLR